MKKSLIALAVAGVVSAPAFAATSNVDVYGKLHVALSFYDDSNYSDTQVSSNASRIGFKGTEDLGGGLAAIWQIESGVNLDEQNGTFASRNSFVGLTGGFGTALIGNHDTPLKLVGRAVDLFGDTIADSRNVLGVGSDTRGDNVVAYISPSWTGFSFAAAYSTDPVSAAAAAGDVADKSLYNLSATYANGPVYVGVGYGDGDYHDANGLGAQYRLAAGFTMGGFKLVGEYDVLNANSGAAVGSLGAKGDYDAWMVGGSYTMGAMVFKANYMEGEYDSALDPEQWTVGMDYNLSKRTSVYVLYADGQNITLGGGGGTSDAVAGNPVVPANPLRDIDNSAFSVGVMHSF